MQCKKHWTTGRSMCTLSVAIQTRLGVHCYLHWLAATSSMALSTVTMRFSNVPRMECLSLREAMEIIPSL